METLWYKRHAVKSTLLRIVEARFPELDISSTHEAILPDTREALEVLIVKVATAPSVTAARLLLALRVLK